MPQLTTVRNCPIVISDQMAQVLTQDEIIHFIDSEAWRFDLPDGRDLDHLEPMGILDMLYDWDYFRDNNSFAMSPERDSEISETPDLENLLWVELTSGLYHRQEYQHFPLNTAIALGMPEGPDHDYVDWLIGYFFH
jgi:hypothetical protein